MSAIATLPLPLELTKPVELSSSLEDALREAYAVVDAKYNHETQVRENAEGIPHFFAHRGSSCHQECESSSAGHVVDVSVDIQIDDNDF